MTPDSPLAVLAKKGTKSDGVSKKHKAYCIPGADLLKCEQFVSGRDAFP